jgi:putative endonuclease
VTDARRGVGAAGEDAAARWYEAQGFTIVARNWRVRAGELDIVARRGRLVVFCEVKARASDRFGTALDAVTRTKQLRLRRLAAQFLAEHPQSGSKLRFDVAAVRPGATGPSVDVMEAAF